ncbi:MAG: hypothetical protein WBW33_19180 [Bryobacteraceae bacterium]
MVLPTLKQYLSYNGGRASEGVRAAAVPFRGHSLSMRSLIAGPRLLHISDLHFTDSITTWDVGGPLRVTPDHQNSPEKSAAIATFLRQHQLRGDLGTKDAVITGDVTDSGCTGDYAIARDFVSSLRGAGFNAIAAPGNDYCWEGNLFFEDVFKAVRALSVVQLLVPGAVETCVTVALTAILGTIPPLDLILAIAALFVTGISGVSTTDGVDNAERRRRFIQSIAPNQTDYPVRVDVPGGALLLLDSMQGQFEDSKGDRFAQGYLGPRQLAALGDMIQTCRSNEPGKKLIVCLYHSPLESTGVVSSPLATNELSGLRDGEELLRLIQDRVDGLLFGHTTPAGARQQPRPNSDDQDWRFAAAEKGYGLFLLNCENLEHATPDMAMPACPVTVIDMGSGKRATYDAFSPDSCPAITWGIAQA